MISKRQLPILLCLLLSCFFGWVSVADACPTCKLAVEGGSNHLQQGYALSILFMMAMPFLIFAGWTVFIFRAVRHRKQNPHLYASPQIADPPVSL